jgi:hypothetical protein
VPLTLPQNLALPAPWRTLLRVLAFVVVAVSGGAAAHQLLTEWQHPLLLPARYQAQPQPYQDWQPMLAAAPALAAIVAPVGATPLSVRAAVAVILPLVAIQAVPKPAALAFFARGPPLQLF